MPQRAKTKPTTIPSASAVDGKPPITRTAAITAALDSYPDKTPKELAEIMQAQGWDIESRLIRGVKSKLKDRKMRGITQKPTTVAAALPAAKPDAAAPPPKDDIPFQALIKAKRMAEQLGGIEKAKAAIAALAELVD